jgi:osmotically-inducible protein OsmY
VINVFTDTEIENRVRAALENDDRIKHPGAIAVYADEIGSVTLRGTVESVLQRMAAVHDARQVDGVYNVIDDLKVHLPVPDRRADDEIRGAALQRLISDLRIPSNHIDVEVAAGWVTLTGRVGEASQRADAEEDIAGLSGVVGISNRIEIA